MKTISSQPWIRAFQLILCGICFVSFPSVLPAWPQTQQQHDWCFSHSATADQKIEGCTALILSGKETQNSLANDYVNRGGAYADKELYDRAIADTTQAIALNPNRAGAYANRGWTHHLKGEDAEGLPDANTAVSLARTDTNLVEALAEIIGIRAAIYEKLGQRDNAVIDYNATLMLNPNYNEAKLGLARLRATSAPSLSHFGGASFHDCTNGCPTMVVIPPGSFFMGDNKGTYATDPKHQVTINYSFAVGRFDVTRSEYARFATETNYKTVGPCISITTPLHAESNDSINWESPTFSQTDRDPVVCMNFYDAQAYVNWLSRKTGKTYRLLSEAEWEYSARAGTDYPNTVPTPDWMDGLPQLCRLLNGGDLDYVESHSSSNDWLFDTKCRDGYVYTSPVGSFPSNGFGLYDMLGNVQQWTADCYNTSYNGAPTDGSVWQTGDCTHREIRGSPFDGSWDMAQTAFYSRFGDFPDKRSTDYGIRVARTL